MKDLCIFDTSTLADALRVITQNGLGTCFVVNTDQQLKGILTDGDIRRKLLDGVTTKSPVTKVMSEAEVTLGVNTDKDEILRSLNDRIKIIPLLDNDGKLVDYATFRRLNRIPVLEPVFWGKELENVTRCIETGWISSQGKFVQDFERALSDFCEGRYCLSASSGTSALHLALVSLGVGEGDEVIVPDYTFAASINSILYTGAKPVIVDVSLEDWNISIEKISEAITENTKAIMPVHIYGQPCDIDSISSIARENDLLVIEDSAEAIGSTYRGKNIGSFSDASVFSFFGNKVITTGEGGAVLFREKSVFEKAKILRDHGMNPEKRYWHDLVGFNYRLTNLQAAVGVAQMEKIDLIIERRQAIFSLYKKNLSEMGCFIFQKECRNSTSSNWLTTVLLSPETNFSRDDVIIKMHLKGIELRPTFFPLSEMDIYKSYSVQEQVNSKLISSRGLSLPSSSSLSDKDIDEICLALRQVVDSFL